MPTPTTCRVSRITLGTLTLAALCAAGPAASAQNALGSGNALDANLRQGSNKRNDPGRDIKQELAFRNAIVTGNAGAGLSFRGDVGYKASDDFRTSVGSNDIYNFQRDSAYSGLATLNIRGISSVQNQLNYSTAGQTDHGLTGSLIINRSGTGASGADVSDTRFQSSRVDPYDRVGGALRAPSVGLVRESDRPDVIAVRTVGEATDQSSGPRMFMIASGLQGVRNLSEDNSAFSYRPTPVTGYRTPDQIAKEETKKLSEIETNRQGPATPGYVSPFEAFSKQLRDSGGRIDSSVPGLSRPTELTEQQRQQAGLPAKPAEQTPGAAEGGDSKTAGDAFDQRMDKLRDLLKEDRDKPKDTPNIKGLKIPGMETDAPAKPEAATGGATGSATGGAAKPNPLLDPASSEFDKAKRIRETLEQARELLSKFEGIKTLAPEVPDSSAFGEHMAKGQELLQAGRWFDAEERFSAALAMQPGDPLAASGRVNAQVAAGMFLSAALNLRNTYRAYPELIAAKFDPNLLPRAERLDIVRAQLRQRAERNTLIGRDAGLLLAYLGRQTGSRQDIADGLSIMARVNDAMNIDADPLEAALKGAWTAAPISPNREAPAQPAQPEGPGAP